MEDKLKLIEDILVEIREEKKRIAEKEIKEKQQKEKDWRTKVELKQKKQKKKKEKLKKQAMLSQHWEMLRWITEFIQEHQDDWDKKRIEEEERIKEELEEWNKSKRLEKIKKTKR